MTTELFHPRTPADVVEIVRGASADRRTLLPVGGRAHIDRATRPSPTPNCGPPSWTGSSPTNPPRCWSWSRRGCAAATSRARSPSTIRNGRSTRRTDATVGGVIAAGASSFRRRRVGHVRDTVVEMTTVTGDGRHDHQRRPHGEERLRLRRAPADDRLAGHAGRHRPGGAEDPAAPPRQGDAPDASAEDAMALADRLADAGAAGGRRGRRPRRAVTLHLEGWPDEVVGTEDRWRARWPRSNPSTILAGLVPRGRRPWPRWRSSRRACRRCWRGHDRWQATRGRRDRLGRRRRAGGTRVAARHGGRGRRDRSGDPRTGRAREPRRFRHRRCIAG